MTIDYTLRVVLAGATAIGLVAGLLGAFAFLRRQSLLGDAVAHCTLPGWRRPSCSPVRASRSCCWPAPR